MFLTIGEKIKDIRKRYNLKQHAFAIHGISQNYISMIESEKRQPTEEMINHIYDALYALTDGQVKSQYDKQAFKMNIDEQVSQYINSRFMDQVIINHYDDSLRLAKKHNLVECCYRLNMEMGDFYNKEEINKECSTYYFMNALQYAIQLNEGIEHVYAKLGRNMRMATNYKQGLIYYKLSAEFTADKNSAFFYNILIQVGLMHMELEEFEEALEVYKDLPAHCDDQVVYECGVTAQHYLYMAIGEFKKATQVYDKYLEGEHRPDILGYIYHNAAYSLMQKGRNKEALDLVVQGFTYRQDLFSIASTTFLKGQIHLKMGDYHQALNDFLQSKEQLIYRNSLKWIKGWYMECLDVYFILKEYDEFKALFYEMRELTFVNNFSTDVLNEVKIKFITQCLEKFTEEKQEYDNLYRFLLEM